MRACNLLSKKKATKCFEPSMVREGCCFKKVEQGWRSLFHKGEEKWVGELSKVSFSVWVHSHSLKISSVVRASQEGIILCNKALFSTTTVVRYLLSSGQVAHADAF